MTDRQILLLHRVAVLYRLFVHQAPANNWLQRHLLKIS